MSTLTATFLFLLSVAQVPNPCTNGSFEEVGPDGVPVDWSILGQAECVEGDAHSGKYAFRMVRAEDDASRETGLNRAWTANSGERGAMIDRLKGGIEFWYKAASATNAGLNVYAIPMNADPLEHTGSDRATFTILEEHIGDGQWHNGRLKYDFTDNPKVKWVHFSARIVGAAGEFFLDDVSYVEKVGGILGVDHVRYEEDPMNLGARCTVAATVQNKGDVIADDVRAVLEVAPALKVTPPEAAIGSLAPDAHVKLSWDLEGGRTESYEVTIIATSKTMRASATMLLAPEPVIENFGAAAPVAIAGEPITVECVIRNNGKATFINPTGTFKFLEEMKGDSLARIHPGRREVLSVEFDTAEQSPATPISIDLTATHLKEPMSQSSQIIIGSSVELPAPGGQLSAIATEDYAILENQHLRLAFRHNEFGFGPGELLAPTSRGWQTVAWLPRLSRLIYRDSKGERQEHVVYATQPPRCSLAEQARLEFSSSLPGAWRATMAFTLGQDEKTISAEYRLECEADADLLCFEGPMVYALRRKEAIFPGLEWLIDDEVSSSTLDIKEGHPHQVRYLVHPNMVTIPAIGIRSIFVTVGLLWDIHQKWDGVRDRPAVVFASPDRFDNQRAHLAGLILPTVPEYLEPNTREATNPYRLEAGKTLQLHCGIYVDVEARDALAAVDEWFRIYGFPEPAPLPHGSYEDEIQFSMKAYLDSLWIPESKEWWTTKNGHPLMSYETRSPAYIADLILGSLLSPDVQVRAQCKARVDEVLAMTGGEARLDTLRHSERANGRMPDSSRAAGLLASKGKDDLWRFEADREDKGIFKDVDYHVLGPDDAAAMGTCARNAFEILQYACITGDRAAYERMRKTLERMERFRVPRAAQVWEVPFHTPDILAAADAVDAYVAAYRFSGEERWLKDAVTWARRGFPFIYFWGDPDLPFLLGSSIPVFGATFHTHSWFGRPVQWNGLRYANALLKLDKHDQTYPWRKIAETVIRSAIHQQAPDGENVALWPDSISAIDGEPCPWVFSPRQIIRNINKLTGRDEDPTILILGEGEQRIHVSAVADIAKAAWENGKLEFTVTYPEHEQGVALVSNLARPAAVYLDGAAVPERADLKEGNEPGWRYDEARAYLAVRIAKDGASEVQVEDARYRYVERLPELRKEMAFEFEKTAEGWIAQHDVSGLAVRDGALCGNVTGNDPYIVRAAMEAPGDRCPRLVLRMRTTGGQYAEFFWTTQASPVYAEDKRLTIQIRSDGEFHDYRFEPGTHELWAGQTITGIRIDPTSGVTEAEFAIDYFRAANTSEETR